MRLQNRVAIVTGGGRGIGRATARLFAAEGARVVCWDLAVSEPTDEADGVESESVDVTDGAAVAEGVERTIGKHGGVDILINNAGIIADAFTADLELDDWDRVLRVNLTGTFLPCQAVIPHFRERSAGVIVNTSSISALGNRGQANYAASKAGVIGLTRTLALELARDGGRVNCVAPGAVDTEMFAQVPDKVREKFLSKIPLGRLGAPDDVARLHLFLASEESSYITGQTIFCDGGWTL